MTEKEVDEAIESGKIEYRDGVRHSFIDPNELSSRCNMLLSNFH